MGELERLLPLVVGGGVGAIPIRCGLAYARVNLIPDGQLIKIQGM